MTAASAAELLAFDEVLAAQRTFKSLIEALARPGRLQTLTDRLPDVPAGINLCAALVAFTLLDQEVRFAAAGPEGEALAAYIVRRTNARRVAPQDAGFLFADGGESSAPLTLLPFGSPEFPERGGTAVLTVDRLSGEPDASGACALTLKGPGVDGAACVCASGLSPEVVQAFAERNREYPLGVDAFLVGRDGSLVGLPRTVRIDWRDGARDAGHGREGT